ncbi:MAG: hypothetical protein HGA45_41595 [Chloroflexales bacterium]|nr:hypothetical protein [Chloroflexales bacterium]
MGSFKNLSEMVVLHHVEGQNAAGETLRVERVARPLGSTLGVVFVRVLVNGQGVSTEQFSGTRVALADRAFKAAAKMLGVSAPAPVAKQAGTPGPEKVLLDEGGVQVVMITGKGARFEIRAPGAEPEVIPATAAWRAEQKVALERGRSLIAA